MLLRKGGYRERAKHMPGSGTEPVWLGGVSMSGCSVPAHSRFRRVGRVHRLQNALRRLPVGHGLDGEGEAGQCILMPPAWNAAVGDDFHSDRLRAVQGELPRVSPILTLGPAGRLIGWKRMTAETAPGVEAPDVELISRWRAGDERAATQLVARHAPSVARYVASLGGRDGVDEVVQDAFVRAFGSLDAFRGESSLRTWLFAIARRLVLDRRRSRRRQRDTAELQDGDVSTEYDALDTLIADEAQGKMRDAIGRLTVTQREVFMLRVNDGMSYKEIAAVVGTTEGAARVHYHNALRQVKETLHAD